MNKLQENMRRFNTMNLNEQSSLDGLQESGSDEDIFDEMDHILEILDNMMSHSDMPTSKMNKLRSDIVSSLNQLVMEIDRQHGAHDDHHDDSHSSHGHGISKSKNVRISRS